MLTCGHIYKSLQYSEYSAWQVNSSYYFYSLNQLCCKCQNPIHRCIHIKNFNKTNFWIDLHLYLNNNCRRSSVTICWDSSQSRQKGSQSNSRNLALVFLKFYKVSFHDIHVYIYIYIYLIHQYMSLQFTLLQSHYNIKYNISYY